MPKRAKELSALQVSRLKADGWHAVGGVPGLGLNINGNAKSWLLRITLGGRRPEVGLGPAFEVTLGQARQKAAEARELVRQGINPIDARKAAKSAVAAKHAASKTFSECALSYIDAMSPEWSNDKHAWQWSNSIEKYASPTIGALQVADVETTHILAVLEPIWRTKTETATRLRGRLEAVIDWAIVRGYREGPNPARWKAHLAVMLPAPSKIQTIVNHATVPYVEMPALMERLANVEGEGAAALRFAILTAARSGEVRGATWSEIDLDAGEWVIPAARMKMRRLHRVPLSRPTLALLRARPQGKPTDLVFRGAREGRPLSDMAMTQVVRRLSIEAVPHGLARASFKTWATEATAHPREVIESALAHLVGDAVEMAYLRGDLFDKRALLMQAWAEFLHSRAEVANVTPIRRNRAAR